METRLKEITNKGHELSIHKSLLCEPEVPNVIQLFFISIYDCFVLVGRVVWAVKLISYPGEVLIKTFVVIFPRFVSATRVGE